MSINAKVGDLFLRTIYDDKKRQVEAMMAEDEKNNPSSFSKRSWMLVLQTIEFVLKDKPLHLYPQKNKKKKG